MADSQTSRNIEDLRNNLAEKLEELHRRASTATRALSPLTYWRDPYVRFGLGVVLGFTLGSRRSSPETTNHAPPAQEGMIHAVVRSGLMAAASVLVTRALTAEPAASEPGASEPGAGAEPASEPAP